MQKNGLVITEQDFWQNTYRSVNNTYCWLKLLEGKNYILIDDAVNALHKLITHGQSIEQVMNYKAPNTPYTSKKNNQFYAPVSYNLEPKWTKVDENTIHVSLGEGQPTVIAIAVNTEEQLDEMIKEVYEATYIAVDCEFLGQKKSLPELKLLQIGVSKEKGYAIQVDKLGPQIINDKIRPILEDENITIIGWSFRSDGLAIEGYMKNIDMAPVLDLQAKLKAIAVEQLNLGAAMSKFASDWVGQEEFQKAKQYGTQFNFTGENCIWTYAPLPPRALVYAVFDVISVIALHEYTSHHESLEIHYWPFTITKGESQRTVDNWHRLRAKGINSPAPGGVNIVSSPLSTNSNCASPHPYHNGKGKETAVTPISAAAPVAKAPTPSFITTLGDGYDDKDVKYKRDLELAFEKSKIEFMSPSLDAGESSSSSKDRVVSTEDISYSEIASELNSTSIRDSNPVFSSHVPEKPSNIPNIVESSWGTEILSEQPFIGNKFKISANNNNQDVTVKKKSPLNVSSPAYVPFRHQSQRTTPVASLSSPQQQQQQQQQQPSEPSQNKKVTSRWSNEPTALSSQWNQDWTQETTATTTTTTSSQWGDKPVQQDKNTNSVSLPPSNNNHRKPYSNASNDSGRSPAATAAVSNSSPRHAHASPRPVHQSPHTPQTTSSWKNQASPFQSNQSLHSNVQGSPARNTVQVSPRPAQASPSWNTATSSSSSVAASPNNNSTFKPSPNANSFKPDKARYSSEFKSRITVGNQGGSFTNYQLVGNEMSSASWKTFAASSVNDWDQGKETPLDAIDKPVVADPAIVQPEPIKFNTKVNHDYVQGGAFGGEENGWNNQEERPDTMEMPLNQIPIRKTFTGPRVMNPDDDMESDNDEDDVEDEDDYDDSDFPILKMNKMGIVDTKYKPPPKPVVQQLETYVDGVFLYGDEGEGELSMLQLNKPEHLNMIKIPEENYTVTICYHFTIVKESHSILKAVQLFLSTGESYTAVIEQCCFVKNFEEIKKSKFGYLLADPNVKRICWSPQTIVPYLKEKTGLELGRCVDLVLRANDGLEEEETMTFGQAVDHYLKDWQDLSLFKDAKKEFEGSNAKKFSSSCWDRDVLPNTVLSYSASQGLTAHALYLETLKQIEASDENFMF